MGGPHFGLILPNYGAELDPQTLIRCAAAAEESGWHSGWVTDHIAVPEEHAPIYGNLAEAMVTLGWLAGATHELGLGVSALVVPQREPLLTLKQLVSLDYLSGGRLVVAIAAGWMEGEFQVLGADFGGRGRALDNWIAMAGDLGLQMPGPVRHSGGLEVAESFMAPGPANRGGLELWAAGVSKATLRRAAVTGVWHPVALTVEDLAPMAAELREVRPDARVVLRLSTYLQAEPLPEGRDERGRPAVVGPPEWVAERLVDYLEAGCDGFVMNLGHDSPGLEDRIRRFGAEVLPAIATHAG